MRSISQEEYDSTKKKPVLEGAKKRLAEEPIKKVDKPIKEVAGPDPVSKQETVNNVHMDMSGIEKVLKQNAELIKALSVQLNKPSINNKQSEKVNKPGPTVFRIKRDSRGLIESIEVGE